MNDDQELAEAVATTALTQALQTLNDLLQQQLNDELIDGLNGWSVA